MENYPSTAGKQSLYVNYICQNWHTGVCGAVLGMVMEAKAMELAHKLGAIINETMLRQYYRRVSHFETYSEQILDIPLPSA